MTQSLSPVLPKTGRPVPPETGAAKAAEEVRTGTSAIPAPPSDYR
jgi:hypothetical protein